MRRGGATNWGWQCGTNTFRPPVRSLLCREREEHNKTKEELVNAKEFANSRIHLADELTRQNVQLLNEVEQAKGAFDNLLETWMEELTQAPYNFEEYNRMKAVVEAARCIHHWHCREPDGMVVSKEAVFRLWETLHNLDQPLN